MSVAAAKIRPMRVRLIGLDGARVASATIVVDDSYPEVVMFNGDPFLLERAASEADLSASGLRYQQVRPFRLDKGE